MTWSAIIYFFAFCTVFVVGHLGIEHDLRLMAESRADSDFFVRENTHFFLWTRRNPVLFQKLFNGNRAILLSSNFVGSNPTIIYVHGFTENGLNDLSLGMRNSFLQREDCNYIAVDWQLLALPPDYFRAVANVQPVGILIGNFVTFLVGQGADLNKFHLIGFSLGAHVVGRAGHTTYGAVPRITGLDPAFPLFDTVDEVQRLDPTDGRFVDVIHTNAGFIRDGRIGFPFPLGHVDFWPNGGLSQRGCFGEDVNQGELSNVIGVFVGGICSHRRAVKYFIESVSGRIPFTSTQCDSYDEFRLRLCRNNAKAIMGFPLSSSARGNFFLNTNVVEPFAMG